MSGRWIAATACLLVAGCGSDERLEARTAERLHGDVEEIRTAAADGDRGAALDGFQRLEQRVGRAERDGRLPEGDAEALREAIAAARTQAERELPEPPPPDRFFRKPLRFFQKTLESFFRLVYLFNERSLIHSF